MKKRFLSMCLFVVMCLTISSPVLAVYNDDSVVTPNNNRYYYVYEYTNYKGPKCFTVSASDAAEEAAIRAVVTTGIGALAGYYAGGNMTVITFQKKICFAFRRVSRFDKKEEIFLFLFIFYVALAVWRRLLFWALQNR